MTDEVVVAVDGGGSKVDALVVAASGQVKGQGRGGGANPNYMPVGEARARARAAIDGALREAGVPCDRVRAAVCAGPGHDRVYGPVLRDMGMTGEVRYVREAEAARALWPERHGATLVLGIGTGSYVWGEAAPGGHVETVDGCGFPIGDDGGGIDIGIRALRSVIWAIDGRGPQTVLRALLAERLGLDSVGAVIRAVHGGELSGREREAGLVPMVAEAAAGRDRVAQGILGGAAREVARSTLAVVSRLGLTHAGATGLCVGGVFGVGDPFVRPLALALRRAAPRLRLRVLVAPPAVGAAALAVEGAYGIRAESIIHALAGRYALASVPDRFVARGRPPVAYRLSALCPWALDVAVPSPNETQGRRDGIGA